MKHIFIANRGEIARRIAKTAHAMGIQTSCLSDQNPPPEYLKTWVTHIHKIEDHQETPDLYLNGPKMMALAKEFGCDSLHPGFGFLSEQSDFAAMVETSSLTWIGPSSQAIFAMASKSQARQLALECQIPCTQALSHIDLKAAHTWDQILAFSEKAAYPLLVKASFGGGGKGMRLVLDPKDLKEACERAYSEAMSSFGNGSLVIERYIEKARHVEVQVFGDRQGQVFILGDRDCSIQRRHQKIIEEAPAFFENEQLRMKLHQAAQKLAQKVRYVSAGTVEFLVSQDETEFFFLEMNTRLQVEHPVTEEIFGLDLVEWQIRVARGEPLPSHWADLKPKGWAIEARLYGENPEQDFFPAPGFVGAFLPYESPPHIRWELGLDSWGQISPFFDPMFAKVIGIGKDRKEATSHLLQALERTWFVGGAHNLAYLKSLLSSQAFEKKEIHTHFIQKHHKEILADIKISDLPYPLWPLSIPEAYRPKVPHGYETLTKPPSATWTIQTVVKTPHGVQILLVSTNPSEDSTVFVYQEFFEKTVFLLKDGILYRDSFGEKSYHGQADSAALDSELKAPVPGKVSAIMKHKGESVLSNETVFVLESMKMEFQIKASKSGTMEDISVCVSEQVTAGQVLGKIL